jgi:hypothetical protein
LADSAEYSVALPAMWRVEKLGQKDEVPETRSCEFLDGLVKASGQRYFINLVSFATEEQTGFVSPSMREDQYNRTVCSLLLLVLNLLVTVCFCYTDGASNGRTLVGRLRLIRHPNLFMAPIIHNAVNQACCGVCSLAVDRATPPNCAVLRKTLVSTRACTFKHVEKRVFLFKIVHYAEILVSIAQLGRTEQCALAEIMFRDCFCFLFFSKLLKNISISLT